MPGFRYLPAALTLTLAVPLSAQGLNVSLGYQWYQAVKDRDPDKLNKIAADRSALNSAVLDYQTGGEGAIHVAVQTGNRDYLNFMLALGANPNLVNGAGETPLTIAVVIDQADEIASLLRYGARLDGANRRGETALIKAVQVHNLPLVELLLAKGADADRSDFSGKSARNYGVSDPRFPAIVKALTDAPKRAARSVAGPKLH